MRFTLPKTSRGVLLGKNRTNPQKGSRHSHGHGGRALPPSPLPSPPPSLRILPFPPSHCDPRQDAALTTHRPGNATRRPQPSRVRPLRGRCAARRGRGLCHRLAAVFHKLLNTRLYLILILLGCCCYYAM